MNQEDLNSLLEQRNELRDAAEGLLNFIRSKFPGDFKEGGRGFTCPHHQALERAVKKARTPVPSNH